MGSIALVGDFNNFGGIFFQPGAAANGSFDVVLGHIFSPRPVNGQAQREVGIRIGPLLRGHLNFSGQTRKNLAARSILCALASFDICPL